MNETKKSSNSGGIIFVLIVLILGTILIVSDYNKKKAEFERTWLIPYTKENRIFVDSLKASLKPFIDVLQEASKSSNPKK